MPQIHIAKSRIILAIEAKRTNPRLSLRKLSKDYNVPRTTLQHRMTGRATRIRKKNGPANLTPAEEEAIVEYILKQDAQGFYPRRADVQDMANLLMDKRGVRRVGKNWTDRFIQRRPELSTRLSRAYDYQRALLEDPDALNAWFRLVANMRAKYGIQDSDFYNYDKTGFMMGIIGGKMVVTRSDRQSNPKLVQPGNLEWATAICAVAADGHVVPPFLCVQGRFHLAPWYQNGNVPRDWVVTTIQNGWTDNKTGLQWLKHFDEATRTRRKGRYRMLVLDGHESHINAEFNEYCKENDIIPLCLLPHSSHLTQPLDVGIFSPLKWAYGDQISRLIRLRITHITKDEFFPAFKAAFNAVFTEQNVKSGFRGSGMVPWNPEAVISKLDIRIRTPSLPGSPRGSPQPWVSQTPKNATEALSQSTLIKDRVAGHQGSSPTPIITAVDQLAKATVVIDHKLTVMTDRIKMLEEANEVLSKRRRAKRTRLQDSEPLTRLQAGQLLAEKGLVEEKKRDKDVGEGPSKWRRTTSRVCGICRKPGHNARTCSEAIDVVSSLDSDTN
jgi:hypothetical protein